MAAEGAEKLLQACKNIVQGLGECLEKYQSYSKILVLSCLVVRALTFCASCSGFNHREGLKKFGIDPALCRSEKLQLIVNSVHKCYNHSDEKSMADYMKQHLMKSHVVSLAPQWAVVLMIY